MKQYEKAVTPIAEIMRKGRERKKRREKAIDIAAVVLAWVATLATMVSVCAYDYTSITPLIFLGVSIAYLAFFAWANGVFDND